MNLWPAYSSVFLPTGSWQKASGFLCIKTLLFLREFRNKKNRQNSLEMLSPTRYLCHVFKISRLATPNKNRASRGFELITEIIQGQTFWEVACFSNKPWPCDRSCTVSHVVKVKGRDLATPQPAKSPTNIPRPCPKTIPTNLSLGHKIKWLSQGKTKNDPSGGDGSEPRIYTFHGTKNRCWNAKWPNTKRNSGQIQIFWSWQSNSNLLVLAVFHDYS